VSGVIPVLVAAGVLSPLDRCFADALGLLADDVADEVLLAAAFASRAVQHGHVCLDLERLLALPLRGADDEPIAGGSLPALGSWCAQLQTSALVGDGSAPVPLVFEAPARLYLYRYACYQRSLARDLLQRANDADAVDEVVLQRGLARLFGASAGDGQRRAAEIAVRRRFSVISGGPGTGKTSTVAAVMALLQQLAMTGGGDPLRICLLAPTGKAAQRLADAVKDKVAGLAISDDVRATIPREASTIHRALGYQRRRPTHFRHDADHPLAADVVLVDEASMVDVALLAKLVAAVAPAARLILLGDRDQLASVEAGAILGDICAAATAGTAIGESVVHLTHSYRYDTASAIGDLATAVNAGDADGAVATLQRGGAAQLLEVETTDDLRHALAPVLCEYFGPLAKGSAADRLAQLEHFRILCAHRRGPLGVDEVNRMVAEVLRAAGLLRAAGDCYDGRPIMITRNDYQLDLFNGDVGVIAPDPDGGSLRAFFRTPAGGLRRLSMARLPPHETVFATTIHKSQGSEFDRVAVLIPQRASDVLTRELVYTGVTRARTQVTLCGSEAVLRLAIGRRVERASGLREALARGPRSPS